MFAQRDSRRTTATMSLESILLTTIAEPLGNLLLKNYLSDSAADFGGSALGVATGKLKDIADKREARRQFERLGERIAIRLLPLFQQEERNAVISHQAVADELAWVLQGNISAEFFLSRDLDPAKLVAALREERPVRQELLSTIELALYHRALDETVRYIVQVASQLPKFQEMHAAQSLQRLARMADDIEQTLETTHRIEAGVSFLVGRANTEDEEARRYEADYREAVVRNLDELELFGADISEEARRHSLSVAYISLNLKNSGWEDDEGESFPTETVLASLKPEAGRMLVRGEAGSGKSTLFRWTAIQAASLTSPSQFSSNYKLMEDNFLYDISNGSWVLGDRLMADGAGLTFFVGHGWENSWRFRVPFLLRLRDCKDGKLPKPNDFPEHVARELGNPPSDWVRSILKKGRALILLDGIDEVPNAKRENLRKQITALVRAYPDNYYIVSTRPAAAPEGWLAELGFREATIDPMSEPDRARFIERWHEAVGRQLALVGRSDPGLESLAAELIDKLPENPQVARLATNPLLCAMICALHRERHRKLPESQSAVCDAVCQMLLHRRERESDLDLQDFPTEYLELSYEEKRSIVQHIAHYMVLNEESRITRKQARHKVAERLRTFPSHSEHASDVVLSALVERSGVLRDAGPDSIDFVHNTIKEFLAAERFVHENNVGLLSSHFGDGAWQPVILFAVATNRPDFASELVRRLVQIPSTATPEDLRARYMFVLRCRAAALHLDPELNAEVQRIEATLFPPRTMADAEALAASGDSVIDFLQYRGYLSSRETAASVRALHLIGTPKAEKALRGYLKDRRKSVASELARAVNPLEIDYVVERVCSKAGELDYDMMRLIEDLAPLVKRTGIKVLDLTSSRVTDLTPIAHLSDLRLLRIGGTPVSDLSPLANCTHLQELDINRTPVNELSQISGLTQLRNLQLWQTKVVDLSPVAALINLQRLNIRGTHTSDLSPVQDLVSLQSLSLGYTFLHDLSPITSLVNLQELFLEGTNVSDLTMIARLKNLQGLVVDDSEISDLAVVVHLTNLHYLSLAGTKVSDLSFAAGLIHLESLDLSDTQVSDLAPIVGLKNLDSLRLAATQVSNLTPLQGLTNLRTLDVSSAPVEDFSVLRNLPRLTNLIVSSVQGENLHSIPKRVKVFTRTIAPQIRVIAG